MVRYAIWLGFLLRLLVAVWNGFFGPSFGAESDALHFHQVAANYAADVDHQPFAISFMYSYILGTIYFLTTDSLFLGSVLSCLAWLVSAHVLMWTMRLLSLGRGDRFKAMLVFALLPSSILWTSVTLREAYQLLFVNLTIYASLKVHLKKSASYWMLLFLAAAVGSMFHGAIFVFGVFVIAATLFWILLRQRRAWVLASLVVVPFAVGVLVYGFALFRTVYTYQFGDGLASAVERYQRAGLMIDARTHYIDDVSIDGTMGLLQFLPVTLFRYLFEPMPWRMSSPVDVAFALENLLRAALIWRVVTGLWRAKPQQRKPVMLIFACYIVLETIWALGTINWGTAARHHISSLGLLVLAAFAFSRRRKRAGTSARRLNPPPTDALLAAS
jgi:hypothetical protein